MTLRLDLPEMPALDLIPVLGDPHRGVRAYTRLLALGPEAAEAARGGLAHSDERPAPEAVLPAAVGLLAGDPSARVRAYAAELVGQWAHSHPAARDAVTGAATRDPSPSVRKKASWFAPGGTIYQRTAPRHVPGPRRRGG
jgi:hypothetical protein